MELFQVWSETYLWRYLHIWFGIIWIGILYYFNFVHTPFMAEADAQTKPGAIQKLLPRALWWFRWGAMFTFITGLILLHMRWLRTADDFRNIWFGAGGLTMMIGALLGITMFLNVWLIIWPNQKVVIANSLATSAGQPANPAAATSAARAGVASRTNTLFSIPMLLFMGAGAHFPLQAQPDASFYWPAVLILLAIYAAIELNAIFGKMRKPLATVRAVITSGFILAVAFYALIRSVSTL